MAEPTPIEIITLDDLIKLQDAQKITVKSRANTSLNRGGSFDIVTSVDNQIFAVVRFAKLTKEVKAEVQPALDKARAKAAKDAQAAAEQPAQADESAAAAPEVSAPSPSATPASESATPAVEPAK